MKKWFKAILATIFSFLICYYYGKFAGFTGFSFAWILNFVLMAWYTFLDAIFSWQYKSPYFNSFSFEKGGKIHRYFGVHFFRKLLVWTGWEKLSRKNLSIKGNKDSIRTAEYRSRSSEAGHLTIFVIVAVVTAIIANSLFEALWLILLNVLLNIYPILVQRYNRPRYRYLLKKMELKNLQA